MPFPFNLPTTSHLTFQTHLTSSTHPSLPSAATSRRLVLRSALKSHKRLPEPAQVNNFHTILSALNSYLPYLLSSDAALSGKAVAGEEVDVALVREAEVEWRPTLSASNIPSREAARTKGQGLDFEVYFVLQTLATIQNLLARQSILGLYAAKTPSAEERLNSIKAASKHLAIAHAIHLFLSSRHHVDTPHFPPAAVDISQPMQSALAELSFAEFTLLSVLKDDPYPAIVIQDRNKSDNEWMIKAPDIRKTRAHLAARLCMSVSEHAAVAAAILKGSDAKVSRDLIVYCEDLQNTGRAKACRFHGIDADLGGETGKAIAYLHAGMSVLGLDVPGSASSPSSRSGGAGLSRLKASLATRKEDKLLSKGIGNWGADAGKSEEGRILEWLEKKWSKMNNTVNVQLIPDWRPLLAALPSGRELPMAAGAWTPELLAEDELARMRAPPEAADADNQAGDDSSEGEEALGKGAGTGTALPVGAFPGTRADYGDGGTGKSYF